METHTETQHRHTVGLEKEDKKIVKNKVKLKKDEVGGRHENEKTNIREAEICG